MNRPTAISLIKELACDEMSWRDDFHWKTKKQELAQRSYEQWTIDEIIRWLKKSKKKDALEALEEFNKRMDDYACSTKDNPGNIMFSIAYDTGMYVYDYLMSYDYVH